MTFRRGGNYLVTGGLGGVGFAIATHLAREHEANLVVVASRPVPEGVERSEWLARHGYDDPTSRRIRRLGELEALGTKVTVVAADLADPESVRSAVEQAERLVGRLDGAIHAAGELRDRPIELATHEDHEVVVGAKARGALALTDELRRRGAELLVLISSTSTVLVPDGQAAYVAANSVLDALAGDHGDLHVRTINYGLWGELGIAAAAAHRSRLGIDDGEPVTHPVLSEATVERDGTVRLVGTLATEHHWLVDEHRTTTGTALLPGTGHLELFLAAIELAPIAGAAVGPVTLLEPLVVPDGVPVTVRVSVAPAGDDGTRWAQIESDGGVGQWRLHSEAQFVAARDDPPAAFEIPVRPDGAAALDPLARPASQLELGPRWNSVGEAWRDGDDIVGRLQLAEQYAGELDAWLAHPALVDVATAFGVSLGEHETSLYVPVGYDGVRRTASLPARPWVRATRQESSTDDLLRVDLTLGDDDGRVLLAIDGLALRPISDPAALADPTVADAEPATNGHHRVAPLVALAEEHGIRAAEGAELLERVLASGRDRLVASSIDLADLLALIGPEPAAAQAAPAAGTAAAPAGNSVLATIRGIWVDLLGVADIGDDDDFFEVGGHSLIAIRLMSRIHKELGVRFQLVTIFDAPTIGALAAKVLEVRPDLDDELAAAAMAATATVLPSEAAATAATAAAVPLTAAAVTKPAHQSLVTISPVGDKAPMFIVHGAGGNILFLWSLARAMAGSRPIYGFQAHGVDGSDMPDATVEEMAARYVAELRAQHQGPYLLGGYSGGGIVTFEMVRQLRGARRGGHVPRAVRQRAARPGPRHRVGPGAQPARQHRSPRVHPAAPVRAGAGQGVRQAVPAATAVARRADRERRARPRHPRRRGPRVRQPLLLLQRRRRPLPDADDRRRRRRAQGRVGVAGAAPRLLLGPVHQGRARRRRGARRPQRDVLPGERAATRRGAPGDPRPPRSVSERVFERAVAALGTRLGVVIEVEPVTGSGTEADRAAGRRAMATALSRAGAPRPVEGHEPDGRPRWPAGWSGSVAHGAGWAVAAVTRTGRPVGVDVERAGALALEDAVLVLDERERAAAAAAPDAAAMATVLWSAKESAFKAWSTAAGGLAGVDPVDIHIDVTATQLRATASGGLAGQPSLAGAAIEAGGVIVTVLVGAVGPTS